jgi:hypothetical protein
MRTLQFDKFAGSEFEQGHAVTLARRVKYRDVRNNPSLRQIFCTHGFITFALLAARYSAG